MMKDFTGNMTKRRTAGSFTRYLRCVRGRRDRNAIDPDPAMHNTVSAGKMERGAGLKPEGAAVGECAWSRVAARLPHDPAMEPRGIRT